MLVRLSRRRLAGIRTLVGREAIRLSPFVALSMAAGATFDLFGTGAPLLLRASGVELKDVGWLQLVYLPIGIAFLWAPLADRLRPQRWPHRITWIVGTQATAAILLVVLGRIPGWPLLPVAAIGLAVSAALSTTDISAQALVVETMPPKMRTPLATWRLIGSSAGSAIGIWMATGAPGGLSQALVAVAVMNTLALVPLFAFARDDRPRAAPPVGTVDRGPRRRVVIGGGAVIGLYCIPAIMFGTVPGLMLLDLGVSLPTTGLLSGAVTASITIAMMLLSSYGLTSVTLERQLVVMGAGVCASGLLLVTASAEHWAPLAIAGVLLEDAFDAGLNVPLANLTYRWAEGSRVASDYALLSGISFLVSLPIRIVSPMLAAASGWPSYFSISTLLYALAVIALSRRAA